MAYKNENSLFIEVTDTKFNNWMLNKKYIVSARTVDSIHTEIKTIQGDVVLTKEPYLVIGGKLIVVEHKNEEVK